MGREHVELHREQETLLMTLYLPARAAASGAPILGDTTARDVLDRVDYDFARLDRLRGNQPLIVSRAKAIDERVRTFLAEHPDAVVLHLGCGLDSRVLRIDPGPGCHVDRPRPAAGYRVASALLSRPRRRRADRCVGDRLRLVVPGADRSPHAGRRRGSADVSVPRRPAHADGQRPVPTRSHPDAHLRPPGPVGWPGRTLAADLPRGRHRLRVVDR